jgi:hypothetical protein
LMHETEYAVFFGPPLILPLLGRALGFGRNVSVTGVFCTPGEISLPALPPCCGQSLRNRDNPGEKCKRRYLVFATEGTQKKLRPEGDSTDLTKVRRVTIRALGTSIVLDSGRTCMLKRLSVGAMLAVMCLGVAPLATAGHCHCRVKQHHRCGCCPSPCASPCGCAPAAAPSCGAPAPVPAMQPAPAPAPKPLAPPPPAADLPMETIPGVQSGV